MEVDDLTSEESDSLSVACIVNHIGDDDESEEEVITQLSSNIY